MIIENDNIFWSRLIKGLGENFHLTVNTENWSLSDFITYVNHVEFFDKRKQLILDNIDKITCLSNESKQYLIDYLKVTSL